MNYWHLPVLIHTQRQSQRTLYRRDNGFLQFQCLQGKSRVPLTHSRVADLLRSAGCLGWWPVSIPRAKHSYSLLSLLFLIWNKLGQCWARGSCTITHCTSFRYWSFQDNHHAQSLHWTCTWTKRAEIYGSTPKFTESPRSEVKSEASGLRWFSWCCGRVLQVSSLMEKKSTGPCMLVIKGPWVMGHIGNLPHPILGTLLKLSKTLMVECRCL